MTHPWAGLQEARVKHKERMRIENHLLQLGCSAFLDLGRTGQESPHPPWPIGHLYLNMDQGFQALKRLL